ncbi:hypothetical protein F383_36712 [Gossypium arboreum]|uniref:Uncharacterized protein n=1 Tax=Gossypium arboreum TaxID=29729 RepID=A0A0B0MD53_GOSAR|nr:hypothetical protein F383_36712 [Gossypium arboreum]
MCCRKDLAHTDNLLISI